jgi:hypothetical protein
MTDPTKEAETYSPEDVAAITAVVREADQAFEKSGGSSRHWVREQFLPRLEDAGWLVVKVHGELCKLHGVEKPCGMSGCTGDVTPIDCGKMGPLQVAYARTVLEALRHTIDCADDCDECDAARATLKRAESVKHVDTEAEELRAEVQRLQARDSEMAMQSRRDAARADANAAECSRLRTALESTRKKAFEYRVAQGRHMPPSWQTHFEEMEDEAAKALEMKPERYLYAEIVKARGTTELVREEPEAGHSELRDLCNHESRTPFGCRNCAEENKE